MREMKRMLFILWIGISVWCCGCGASLPVEQAQAGRIGDDLAVSRAMAAKMISLTFYTEEELQDLEAQSDFPDVSTQYWAYPYINGAVALGFLSGDEDGNFYPERDLTLTQAQLLMDRLAPDMENRIALDEENQNMPVAYSLWVELWETALQERGGTEEVSAYGITERESVLFAQEGTSGLFDQGKYGAEGLDLAPFMQESIRFWEKDGEILALLEVTDTTPTVTNIYCRTSAGMLTMETGEGSVTVPCDQEITEGICDVSLAAGTVTEIQPAAALGACTVKRVNGQEIYLAEQGLFEWANGFRIYDRTQEESSLQTVSKLTCGMRDAEYYMKDGKIAGAVIMQHSQPEDIRVLIGGAGQKTVQLSAETEWTLRSSEAEKTFAGGETAQMSADLPWFDYGIVEASVPDGSPITVTFTDGTTRAYYGTIELERRSDGISVINTLPLETYLKGVVPHEMPVSFGKGALQAQAITARSYAYCQVLANSYCGYGAHLADTVASQVYLGADTDAVSDQAVDATKGMCLTVDGEVITTYFYSTSGGYGANAKDVWSADGTFSEEEKPYLTGTVHGVTGEKPTDETAWLDFWQDWEKTGYDQASPWYRWKVYFGAGQLTEITAETLAAEAKRHPAHIEVLQEDGTWMVETPKDLGKLCGISVMERGESGVVKILRLDYAEGSVRVKTEYSIRQVLSPTRRTIGEPIYLQKKDGTSVTDVQILPSGYFAVKEMKNDAGILTGVALYGGGNGHGVGLSQYGASAMSEMGSTAEEILTHYFPGTSVREVMNQASA